MLSLFRPRLPIDEDELDWQLASFKWLIAEFGPIADTPLVLPTREFFPPPADSDEASVQDWFEAVRRLAGMESWPCELEAGERDRPTAAGNAHLLRHEGPPAPAGTFAHRAEGTGTGRIVITYNPDLADDPTALIGTFAHELGHYLMHTAASAPPGGWDMHELHTDLCAVYMGFGIFLANGARDFRQFQSGGEMGWSSNVRGYLGEGALVTAIAIFQRLRGHEPTAAAPYLKDYLRSDLKRADKALARLAPDVPAAVAAADLDAFVRG